MSSVTFEKFAKNKAIKAKDLTTFQPFLKAHSTIELQQELHVFSLNLNYIILC